MTEYVHLFKHDCDPNIPQGDILPGRYVSWDMNTLTYNVGKKGKIILEKDGDEIIFVTPTVQVINATVNDPSVDTESYGEKKHIMRISKNYPKHWQIGAEALPYALGPADWFDQLEKVVDQCLRIAFNDPDMYEKATEDAWGSVNIEGFDNPETEAYAVFKSRANLPYNGNSWTLKKNMKKGKEPQFITMVDITNTERTGCFSIEQGALVSVGIRLWPYYMNEHVYGVSASFGNAGVKVFHKGGHITPRRTWNKFHTCIVKSTQTDIYDVRGGVFTVTTPICTIEGDSVVIPQSSDFLECIREYNKFLVEQGINAFSCCDLMNGKMKFIEQTFLQDKKYILTMEVHETGLKVKKVITI
jgi:hypothetical protein